MKLMSHAWLRGCGGICCREDHDLAAGAVLVAVLEKGDGNVHPKEGDMVSNVSSSSG